MRGGGDGGAEEEEGGELDAWEESMCSIVHGRRECRVSGRGKGQRCSGRRQAESWKMGGCLVNERKARSGSRRKGCR